MEGLARKWHPNTIVMKTAVLALAVPRHSVYGECLSTSPLFVALMAKLRLDVFRGRIISICCHRSSSWMRKGFGVQFFCHIESRLCRNRFISFSLVFSVHNLIYLFVPQYTYVAQKVMPHIFFLFQNNDTNVKIGR